MVEGPNHAWIAARTGIYAGMNPVTRPSAILLCAVLLVAGEPPSVDAGLEAARAAVAAAKEPAARADAATRLALALLAEAQGRVAAGRAESAAEPLAEAKRLVIAPPHLVAWIDAWTAEAKALRDVEKRRAGAAGERLAALLALELGRPGELADRPELAGDAAALDERALRARIAWYERGLKTGTPAARAGAAEGLRRALHEAQRRKLLAGAEPDPKDRSRGEALDHTMSARGWAPPLGHPGDGLDLLMHPAFAAWRWTGEGLAGADTAVEIPVELPSCYEVALEVATTGDMPVQVRFPLDQGSGVICDLTRSGPGMWLTHPNGPVTDRRRDSAQAAKQALRPDGQPASILAKVWRDGPRYAVRIEVNGLPAYELAGAVPGTGRDDGARRVSVHNFKSGSELRIRRFTVRPLISGRVMPGRDPVAAAAPGRRGIDPEDLVRAPWRRGSNTYFNPAAIEQDAAAGSLAIAATAGTHGKAALILDAPPLGSARPRIALAIANDGPAAVPVGLAIKVGAAGTWFELPPQSVAAGAQVELAGDLRSSNWTSADSAWLPMSGPETTQHVMELIILVHNGDQPARLRLVAGKILPP